MRLTLAALPTVALLVSGCSKQTEPATATRGPLRWAGALQSVQARTGNVQATGQTRAYGTVTLSVSERDVNRSKASLVVNVPASYANTQLQWGLIQGTCGAGGLPVVAVERFPMIEIGNNGRGQLEVEIPLTLPTGGSYHVNVYRAGSRTLDNVLSCANLKRSGGA